jgi:hypothetical protein
LLWNNKKYASSKSYREEQTMTSRPASCDNTASITPYSSQVNLITKDMSLYHQSNQTYHQITSISNCHQITSITNGQSQSTKTCHLITSNI